MTKGTRASIPGISEQVRDKAMKLLLTKKYQSEYLSLVNYVAFMPGDDILSLAPASLEDLAMKYPYPGADHRDWEKFQYAFTAFQKEEIQSWAERVLDRAREQLAESGPMQRPLA